MINKMLLNEELSKTRLRPRFLSPEIAAPRSAN
jgi:hypothetical protein